MRTLPVGWPVEWTVNPTNETKPEPERPAGPERHLDKALAAIDEALATDDRLAPWDPGTGWL